MRTPLPSAIGRYQVRERIGHGGMGVVYLAVDPLIERLVAVKLLRADSDEMHARFVREARLAGRLQHKNIVTIFDVGEHEGQPFIAMEYVAGETLAEQIRRRIPLSLDRKVHLIADLCDGLAYAHKAGIVHRDIKPSNIILSRSGVLKILDFGIAREAESGLTQTGMMVGTPSYMSPEQVDGRTVDHRSDMFSAGLLLYEILVLRQAFSGEASHLVAQRVLTATPEPLLRLSPDLDPTLVEIVDRAIQKDPDARYPDMSAMRLELLQVAQRLEAAARDRTVVSEILPASSPTPGSGIRPVSDSQMGAERAAQITSHLDAARRALDEERYEAAIEAADRAAVLDGDDVRVHELIERARAGIDERQLRASVEEARQAIARGALPEALRLAAQALKLNPHSNDALSLRREIETLERERERAAARVQAIDAAMAEARSSMHQGAYESAIRSAAEALVRDPTHDEAHAIQQEAAAAIEAIREREDRERRANEAIRSAKDRFQGGEHEAAIADLEQFNPSHSLITRALIELRREVDLIKRREQEELARRALEEEARRAQAERLRRETWVAAQLGAARHAIASRDYERALTVLQRVGEAEPATTGLAELQAQARDGLEAVQAEARQRKRIDEHVRDASRHLAEGSFGQAERHTDAGLALDPNHKGLAKLRIEIRRAVAAVEQRRRQEDLDQRAHRAVADAQREFAEGRYEEALSRLAAFAPAHDAVSDALMTLKAEAEGIEREHAEAEDRLRAQALAQTQTDLPVAHDAADASLVAESEPREASYPADPQSGEIVGAADARGASASAHDESAPSTWTAPSDLSGDVRRKDRGPLSGWSGRRWAAVGLGVSTVAAGALLAFSWVTRPPPQTGAPSATATPSANVSTALGQAQEQWARSDRQGALATVEAALASQPDEPALRRFLGEIVGDALARAERAEAEARQVRAEELAGQRFQEAAVKLKEAEPLNSAGQPLGASKLWEAEALFMAAAADARSAAAVPSADQKLAAILQQARDLWTRRNRTGALALLADQLAQQPQSQPLQALVGELATDAARSMERARAEALGVRAPELTRADFARADAKAAEAKQLQRSARGDRGAQAFLEAEGLFAAAVLAAESAKPRPPPPENATPPADAPKLNASAGGQGLPEIGSSIRPTPPAPPPSAPPPAPVPANPVPPTPSVGSAALDTARIDRLLARYTDAYRRLDFDALREIFPGAGADRKRGIDQSRKSCKAYDVTITSRQISMSTSGSVMLTLQAVHTCTPRTAQKGLASPLEEIFVLHRDSTDNWFIEKTGLMDR